jgi:hypothetical protein
MLEKIKDILQLNPKTQDEKPLNIQVGLQGDKIIIKLDRKVNTITFDKVQLANLLSALATRAQMLK